MRRSIFILLLFSLPSWLFAQKECIQEQYLLRNSGQTFSLTNAVPVYNNSGTPAVIASSPSSLPIISVPLQVVIPVVVHILESASCQVSDAQVQSQLDALNRDFQAVNEDLARVPARFRPMIGKAAIRFELARVNPAGQSSTGIVRVSAGVSMYGLDDRIKFSSKGGDDAWPADHYLNIWVGNMVGGIMGYSSMPGEKASLDGVVLNHTVFGTLNKSGRYTLGRIAVHEVGHWLGLKHIWGDSYCGDDGVADTPPQKSYNRGCPSGILTSCGSDPNGDMYMNFMDLTDDSCMYFFTKGQVEKIRSGFLSNAARNSILEGRAFQVDAAPIDPDWGRKKSSLLPQALLLYPVPAIHELQVEIPDYERYGQKKLLLFNQMGQQVLEVQVKGKRVKVPVQLLKKGTYFIKTDQAGQPVGKFLKM